MSDDPKLSQRYRELPREEPPRALDEAILAAARRAVRTRPAPLVVPSGRQRWYFPLAAAAVIMLAVAVTVHVERERPDAEAVVVQRMPPEEAKRAPVEEPSKAEAPRVPQKKAAPQFTPEPPPQPAPAPAAPPPARPESRDMSAAREAASAEGARADRLEQAGALAKQQRAAASAPLAAMGATPEQWLQGIDDLKRQGRHEEAEKQLAEFRKRYPNYRIPEAITEKFEKR